MSKPPKAADFDLGFDLKSLKKEITADQAEADASKILKAIGPRFLTTLPTSSGEQPFAEGAGRSPLMQPASQALGDAPPSPPTASPYADLPEAMTSDDLVGAASVAMNSVPALNARVDATDGDVMDNVTFKLPRRILDQLDEWAYRNKRPKKCVVLEALRDKGFDIRPEDIEDNRGSVLKKMKRDRLDRERNQKGKGEGG